MIKEQTASTERIERKGFVMPWKLRPAGCAPQWSPHAAGSFWHQEQLNEDHEPVFVSSMVEVLLHVAKTGAVAEPSRKTLT